MLKGNATLETFRVNGNAAADLRLCKRVSCLIPLLNQ